MKNLHTQTFGTIDLQNAKNVQNNGKFSNVNTLLKSNEINGLFRIKYGKNLESKEFQASICCWFGWLFFGSVAVAVWPP